MSPCTHQAGAIYWNPYNRVFQCHQCGLIFEPVMTREELRELVAQAWCLPSTQHKVMDPTLAEAIVYVLMKENRVNEDNNINKVPRDSQGRAYEPCAPSSCDSVPQRRLYASEIVQKLEAENEQQRELIRQLKNHNHELDDENRVLRKMVKEIR